MEKIARSFGTHDGAFHADEVTACALLLHFHLIDEDKIYRTRDESVLARCEYVCDVGGEYDPARKLFDHHQHGYRGEFSSAGMIWKYLQDERVVNEEIGSYLRSKLIKGVDDHDNGREPSLEGVTTFSLIVSNFAPIAYEAPEEERTAGFFHALSFVRGHIARTIERYSYVHSCGEEIIRAMKEGKDYLFFDRPLPWLEGFFANGGEQHPARFVIMPTGEHWKLRGIPPSLRDRMSVRQPLPEEWAGLLQRELCKETGIPGAIFCHKARFISIWETKEDALEALRRVL